MENMSQLRTLSESKMLALWKQIMHLDAVRHECTVERDDGIDIDALLLTHISQWYAHLLATTPVEWLPVDDVKADVTMTADSSGVVTAIVPARCVRPVEWKLSGWQCSVTRFLNPDDDEARLQHDTWLRAGKCHPAVVDCSNRLLLYSIDTDATPVLDIARCVVRPADGSYIFHNEAIATIPGYENGYPSLL
jgi:hypothetical protein